MKYFKCIFVSFWPLQWLRTGDTLPAVTFKHTSERCHYRCWVSLLSYFLFCSTGHVLHGMMAKSRGVDSSNTDVISSSSLPVLTQQLLVFVALLFRLSPITPAPLDSLSSSVHMLRHVVLTGTGLPNGPLLWWLNSPLLSHLRCTLLLPFCLVVCLDAGPGVCGRNVQDLNITSPSVSVHQVLSFGAKE